MSKLKIWRDQLAFCALALCSLSNAKSAQVLSLTDLTTVHGVIHKSQTSSLFERLTFTTEVSKMTDMQMAFRIADSLVTPSDSLFAINVFSDLQDSASQNEDVPDAVIELPRNTVATPITVIGGDFMPNECFSLAKINEKGLIFIGSHASEKVIPITVSVGLEPKSESLE